MTEQSPQDDVVSLRDRVTSHAQESVAPDDPEGLGGYLRRICRSGRELLPATGVAINLMSKDGSIGVAAASDDHAVALDENQFSLGEGPCYAAFASRRPMLADDLQRDGERWPAYRSALQDAGIAAVFAFPLHIGSVALGTLDLYRSEAQPLSDEQMRLALTLADLTTEALIDSDTTVEGHAEAGLGTVLDYRNEIYQAQGMAAVQLAVSLDEALSRMRARAFVENRELGSLARDIVARRVRLEREHD